MPAAADQPLLGFLSNDAWEALLADLNERIERMEALPDGETKQQVFALLNGIDTMRQSGLLSCAHTTGDVERTLDAFDKALHTLEDEHIIG